jgi:hypothetical protein
MRTILLSIFALVALTWGAPGTQQEIQTRQTGERAQALSQPGQTRHPLDAYLQAQLDGLDLQKRQLEEAAQQQIRETEELMQEQIEQTKRELARQIEQSQRTARRQAEQTQSYVKRQVELLEAQKKLLVAQAGVVKQTALGTAPKAGAATAEEKLDRILDRLERLEKRIDKLEKRAPGAASKK